MPLQLYDKEKILDACLGVFARHGYENTSVAMLAEAAGVSKALMFHHFKSKKELYLNLLDQCFEKGKTVIDIDSILESEDFFEVKEKLSIIKFDYYKKNIDLYKVVTEAFYETPAELKDEVDERYGAMIAVRKKLLEQLFEKVLLREGVVRSEAFELITLTLDYFDSRYLSELQDGGLLDEAHFKKFLDKRNSFISMIRYGIQK